MRPEVINGSTSVLSFLLTEHALGDPLQATMLQSPQLCCSGTGAGVREVSREKGVRCSSPEDKRGEGKLRFRDPLT